MSGLRLGPVMMWMIVYNNNNNNDNDNDNINAITYLKWVACNNISQR